jgi:hypothetical protein
MAARPSPCRRLAVHDQVGGAERAAAAGADPAVVEEHQVAADLRRAM